MRYTYKNLEQYCDELNKKMAEKGIGWILVPNRRYGYTALDCETTAQHKKSTINRTVKTCATPRECSNAATEFVLEKLLA